MSIKDKELLTFSNATNLDWQFGDIVNSYDEATDITTYKRLNTLLTPESFIREDKEKNFIGYPYMPNVRAKDSATDEEKEKGLDEMRKNAPVVMNYLEV